MSKFLNQKEAYLKCKRNGCFIVLEQIDYEIINSTLNIAKGDIEAANTLINHISKDNIGWNGVYKLYYDALHELSEAFLRFKKIKSDNHQCLFAYLCENFLGFEFNWNFFEKIRTKRNGINYYGKSISYSDWKEVEIEFKLHINYLIKKIEEIIKNKK
jgi:hypothetical protein